MAETILGIDLGTTNSLVAVADAQGPRILEGPDGRGIMPSVVRFDADGSVVVGEDARAKAIEFPQHTISSVKRLMGRSVQDAQADLPYLHYQVVQGEHNTARVAIPGSDGSARVLSPQEISAAILSKLRQVAEDALGQSLTKAVVTVPAYFDDAQRQATRDAGRLAGLEVVRIVNEPTAAALAYGFGAKREEHAKVIAIYDLGGGTFDVSILRLTPAAEESDRQGLPAFFEVLSTAGDTRLGGDDVDLALVRMFIGEIGRRMGRDIEPAALPPETRRALSAFAQSVKHRLSEERSADIRVDLGNQQVYERTVTRDELEAMMNPWIDRTIAACERALRDAKRKLSGAEIDAVIMVGGSTRVPLVRRRVAEFFGVEPYTAIDPDRVVALGAAVQAGILSGASRGALLLDVIPLSLGIETAGGAMAKLIVRNTTVPTRAKEMFSTSVDGQTSIKLNVLQGEREMAEDCRSLGEFHLSGLPPMPAGIPKLEVEFLVDASGVLKVSAVEQRSGKRASIQIIPNHGLTQDEVERIEHESVAHAREDMTRHRVVDLVENGKLDLKWIGDRLDRFGDQLSPDERRDLEMRIGELRELVKMAESDWRSVDPNQLHAAKETLDAQSMRLQEISITESLRAEPRSDSTRPRTGEF